MGEAKPVKHLAQLLRERQEPFVLEVYLSERGYSRRRSCSDGKAEQKRKTSSPFSRLLRALCDRAVVAIHGGTRSKKSGRNREGECNGVRGNTREAAELDQFSSASSTTVYNSYSDSDPDERPDQVQNASDQRNMQPTAVPAITSDTLIKHPDHKSQQQDLHVSTAWPEVKGSICRLSLPKKITEETVSSESTFELLLHCKHDRSSFTRSTQPVVPKTSLDYLNSKRVLQQTKQLLFDCMKEVIETYGGKKNKNPAVAPEEIGKVIREKIVRWEGTRGNELRIDELLDLHYSETVDEWKDCVHQKMQISLEIGDALMEDITNEIVAEMIGHY